MNKAIQETDWAIEGPTNATRNILILNPDGVAVATVPCPKVHDALRCRALAMQFARAEKRKLLLIDLLGKLEADEGRWPDEVKAIRIELRMTDDEPTLPSDGESDVIVR
jgi:hypothetical protein